MARQIDLVNIDLLAFSNYVDMAKRERELTKQKRDVGTRSTRAQHEEEDNQDEKRRAREREKKTCW